MPKSARECFPLNSLAYLSVPKITNNAAYNQTDKGRGWEGGWGEGEGCMV